jgi:uncharacterized oxidoreductase
MKTTGNIVLITGGGSGIGFEIAKLFSQKGNQVIITGRNAARLQQAASQLKNTTAIPTDINNEEDVARLLKKVNTDFPGLNILINNAGHAYAYQLSAQANAFEKASQEMLTNYLSVIRLTEKFLPLLAKQKDAAIVNVSSIVAFVPSHTISTYAASKAALHSYSQALRFTLEQSGSIKVFELMPPLVNTEFSKEIGGENGIPPAAVAEALFESFEKDNFEIHVGNTADIYQLHRSSPAEAFQAMNQRR